MISENWEWVPHFVAVSKTPWYEALVVISLEYEVSCFQVHPKAVCISCANDEKKGKGLEMLISRQLENILQQLN